MVLDFSAKLRHNLWRGAVYLTEDRFEKYHRVKKWEDLTVAEVEERQQELLDELLTLAVNNVPYYRERFQEEDLVSDGVLEISSIEELPILTKTELQNNFDRLKHDSLDSFSWYVNRSGGSTGEPTKFIQCEEYRYWNYGVGTRINEWAGYREGYPRIKLWGSERDVFDTEQSLKSQFGQLLRNETILDAFSITDDELQQYTNTINNKKPVQIYTYVDAIHELSKYINDTGAQVHSPHSIMTTGGTLHPHFRQTIEDAFRTEVYNRYGCREAGDIACECQSHDGLHIIAPFNYVEIVDENGNQVREGEEGRILITTLRNPAMPLIRYEVGDVGVKGETGCTCGLAWPKIETVSGRYSDMVQIPDGVVSPISFLHVIGVLLEKDTIKKYQVIQEDEEEFTIKIVPKGNEIVNYSELERQLIHKIQQVVGSECELRIQEVEVLGPDDSGKYRYFKSRL